MTVQLQDLEPLCKQLRLKGIFSLVSEQVSNPDMIETPFLERLHALLCEERDRRSEAATQRRLKQANLRHKDADIAGINYTIDRGLNKLQINSLASCDWVNLQQNVIITGPTGVGKSWVAAALANAVCRQGFTAQFVRVPYLLATLRHFYAIGDVVGAKQQLQSLTRAKVLLLDDWGIGAMDALLRCDLLEIIEQRCYKEGSLMITSVLPVKDWAAWIGDATMADVILDRIVSRAHRIEMTGPSFRQQPMYGAVQPSGSEK